MTKRKVVDSMLKKHQQFLINIGNYRDKSIQTPQLFEHFRCVNFWSRDRAPSNSVCIKHSLVSTLCLNFSFAR